ncbi:MAG: alpha/beta hydrolase [Candidatus Curtissbacteria bacterium]|nr:alpha/beta hydrolase [Candidatus Curtissbacteria bacterium]
MKVRKIQTNNNLGDTLVGLETQPDEGRNKYPSVVLVHGFGATKEEGGMFDDITDSLAKSGILVSRFDFSGRGESEGNYSDTSLSKQRDDLESILDFVKSQPLVDTARIGVLGQSFGTPTTITLHPDIKSLVLMGSFGHVKEIMKNLFGDGYNPSGISTRVKTDGETVKLNPVFWSDFENHDILASMKLIKYPVLFIHGSEDDIVPVSEMEALFNVANEPKEKVVIEGGDHGLDPHRDKMIKAVVDWFRKTL